jgi:predicted RNase H-like nuclease (RuvC/YqgF family)
VALFYLLPLLYDQYVRPLEQNTVRVSQLQSRQEQTEQELADLQTKLSTLEDVQTQHDRSLADLDQRLNDIESEITARTESLATLEKMQAELQEQNKTANVELQRQVDLVKAMELLSRARLFMYQSNFGLARQDVQIARDVLASVQPDTPKDLAPDLEAVVQRLDMALSNLPNFPVAASDDLDIAWQILLTGLPDEATPTPVASATPTAVGTLSATPTGLATSTPTLVATLPPSATP